MLFTQKRFRLFALHKSLCHRKLKTYRQDAGV